MPLAPQRANRNVTVMEDARFCKALMPLKLMAVWAFPLAVVVVPHVMVEPISVKVEPFVLYCH